MVSFPTGGFPWERVCYKWGCSVYFVDVSVQTDVSLEIGYSLTHSLTEVFKLFARKTGQTEQKDQVTKGQNDKSTKGQKDKGMKGQKNKRKEGQKDKRTKRQRDKRTT